MLDIENDKSRRFILINCPFILACGNADWISLVPLFRHRGNLMFKLYFGNPCSCALTFHTPRCPRLLVYCLK